VARIRRPASAVDMHSRRVHSGHTIRSKRPTWRA
jgi:hypothetical protein